MRRRTSAYTGIRRGGRAVECTGLENQQGLVALRGFESHPLRQIEVGPKRGPPSIAAEGVDENPPFDGRGREATRPDTGQDQTHPLRLKQAGLVHKVNSLKYHTGHSSWPLAMDFRLPFHQSYM